MVVMGHVLAICVRGIDRAALFKLIGEVHMPLFFFISGYFTYKRLPDGKIAVPDYFRRAVQLLVPMVAVSTIWIYYYPSSGLESPFTSTFSGLWTDAGKNGYWFTPVLFALMVIYGLCTPLLTVFKSATGRIAAIVVVWAAMLWGYTFVSSYWAGILSLEFLVRFFPVFMFGALAREYADSFRRIYTSPLAMTLGLPAAVFLLWYVGWYWLFPSIPAMALEPARSLLHLALVAVGFSAAASWAETDTFFTRLWTLLGRKSLGIYLLHYFFLFPMGCVRPALEAMNLAIVPLTVFSAVVAAAVVAMVLLVMYLLAKAPWLNCILTGAKIPTGTK